MEGENGEVVEAVADLARQADSVSTSEAVLDAVIDNAQERVAAAEETAEQIAAAAMESARGQEIENLRRDFFTWQNEQASLKAELSELKMQTATLQGQLSALATLQVAQETPNQNSLSLTPPTSDNLTEAIEEVETILPESLSESAVVESPAPLALAAKRQRWI